MFFTKLRSRLLGGSVAAIILLLLLAWHFYASPQARTARHLGFIHQSIAEMHPAVLEADAAAFHTWHQDGYLQARGLLSRVKTIQDGLALLNFYTAGYEDAHMTSWLTHSPFQRHSLSQTRLWTGWLLKARSQSYEVVFSLDDPAYPPVGAQLLACDGHPIDQLLQTQYAPFIDRRWHILQARDRAAKTLTLQQIHTPVLDRPRLSSCEFLVATQPQTFAVNWLNLTDVQARELANHLIPTTRKPAMRELREGYYWVNASDFKLLSPDTYAAQEALLHDLRVLREPKLVIFDLRSNGGGSSAHGNHLFNSLLAPHLQHYPEALNYLLHQQHEHFGQGDAYFRASWKAYWSDHYRLNEQIRPTQGGESDVARGMRALTERMKSALEQGQPGFYQSELGAGSSSTPPPESPGNWTLPLKLVVLTDQRCVSACLDFVDLLKLVPGLLHLGEPTDADTAYTQVAYMLSSYLQEQVEFMVPVKKWNKRMRADNQAYIPDVIYEGDMNDDAMLEQWVIAQVNHRWPTLASDVSQHQASANK